MSDTIVTKDPVITEKRISTDSGIIPVNLNKDNQTEAPIVEMTIKLDDGDEATIPVDGRFITSMGTIVGNIIEITNPRPSPSIRPEEGPRHWVYIDYRDGNHHDDFGEGGVSSVPLGEIAKQISNGDMIAVDQPKSY